jgi:hypothetical protein
MPELRVLDRITRPMQRLGYLKRLVKRVTTTSTSNLDNLGHDLLDTAMRKVRTPLDERLATYIKVRLFDNAYATIKQQADGWLKNGSEPPVVAMELQDLYLADAQVPSGVGKLVRDDWRKYPPLATSLGLIREGTYSANTRALSLLYFTPETELRAFQEYFPEANPLRLSRQQGLLLLYALIENDGEVLAPLWSQLAAKHAAGFNDREAGNLLPEIYRAVIARHRTRLLPADVRDRLLVLEKSADSITQARQSEKYTGGSAREESSRVRVEPFADICLFCKPDPFKYEYGFCDAGRAWAEALANTESSQAIGDFLANRFFTTAAAAWAIPAQPISASEEIVPHLQRASKAIKSPGGYAPIEELALVAGIEGLLDRGLIIEPEVARKAIIAYQKDHPYEVRFTVDRMGVLAHARFVDPNEPA